MRQALAAKDQRVKDIRLDAAAQAHADNNSELFDIIRRNISINENGQIVTYYASVSVEELGRRGRIAIGLPPAFAPIENTPEARAARAAEAARILRQDELARIKNWKADVEENRRKGDINVINKMITDIERELNPAERFPVMSPSERRQSELALAAATASGEHRPTRPHSTGLCAGPVNGRS